MLAVLRECGVPQIGSAGGTSGADAALGALGAMLGQRWQSACLQGARGKRFYIENFGDYVDDVLQFAK